MFEQEKQRASNLIILLIETILIVALVGESLLLGWDSGAVILLLLGLAVNWAVYITGKVPESTRMWLYFVLAMLGVFFYGIHETSIFDVAPLMIVIIILFSSTGNYKFINLCVFIYFFILGYDFVFVLGGNVKLDALSVTRTIIYLVFVFMAGQLMKKIMQARVKEIENINKRIEELEEINRRTEDFLTNVSHELRTPINAVTGITTIMPKNEDDVDKKKNILSVQKAGYYTNKGQKFENLGFDILLNDEKICVGLRNDSDLIEKVNGFLKSAYEDGTIISLAKQYGIENALLD